MATKLSKPITLMGLDFYGCDDWLVFCRSNGAWFYFMTECDPGWNEIAHATRREAGLGDDPPDEVIICGIIMALRGEIPIPALPECVLELDELFRPLDLYQ